MDLSRFYCWLFPILEISAFILIGGQIGVLPTLLMIFVTAVIGTFLLRSQGFHLLGRIQQKMSEGEMPGKDLVHGIMILVAGILLLTPGFVTDGIGFLLFFPPFRELLWKIGASRLVIHTAGNPFDHSGGPHPILQMAMESLILIVNHILKSVLIPTNPKIARGAAAMNDIRVLARIETDLYQRVVPC